MCGGKSQISVNHIFATEKLVILDMLACNHMLSGISHFFLDLLAPWLLVWFDGFLFTDSPESYFMDIIILSINDGFLHALSICLCLISSWVAFASTHFFFPVSIMIDET